LVGIGRYLSAEVVERHGGRIWPENEIGIGLTFYVILFSLISLSLVIYNRHKIEEHRPEILFILSTFIHRLYLMSGHLINPATTLKFLQGGGEMGMLTRAHNWSPHTLGPPETWPVQLKQLLGTLLHAPSPALICWGK
jgi:hypothetical protein